MFKSPKQNKHGHVDKTKGGRIEGGKWGWLGWGRVMGEMETTVLEQQ